NANAPLAISALVDYETALLPPAHQQSEGQQQGAPSEADELPSEDRPRLLEGVEIIDLAADYQEIVRRLRERTSLHDVPNQPVKLAVRRTRPGDVEVRQLSPLSAELIELCSSNLTVEEITAEFLLRQIQVSGIPPEKVCLAGLEILRQQRLIA